MSVSINGTSGLVFNDASTQNTAATGFGFKNRIINGDCRIDQRNAGASVTNDSAVNLYPVDRFIIYGNVSSKFTAQQNAGSVTPPNGFRNYLGCTSSSSYTVGAGELFFVQQRVEGYNMADLGWGTASASTVTISFWVRSSLTGTFGGSIQNDGVNRSYPFTYTITTANTWEQKSVTIAGDTSGTWLTTNGLGMRIYFGLGVGSTYSGTAGAWAGADYRGATGATSVVGTNGATFYITGVQLEKGSTATSFDYRPYGTELLLCQRYYGRFQGTGSATGASFGTGIANNTAQGAITVQFPVSMRASPTLSVSQLALSDATNYDSNVTSIAGQNSSLTNCRLVLASAGGMTALRTTLLIPQGSTSGYVDFSAEL
tara:strand:- start:1371 stop:2486 length:1116 start_codon:yes stop_codon:yes gene_type:complete